MNPCPKLIDDVDRRRANAVPELLLEEVTDEHDDHRA